MNKSARHAKIYVSLMATAILFGAALYWGGLKLEQRLTDLQSEQLAIREAGMLAEGAHSYGIVEYTHYPNGPQYILALMMKAGINGSKELRAAPLVFSAVCVAFLGFCVSMTGASFALSALGLAGIFSLLGQPGIIQWMGALYGNSYSLAICLAAIGATLLSKRGIGIGFALGFVSGWMGYDFTFCLIGAVLAGRLLVVALGDDSGGVRATSVLFMGVSTSIGVLVAIATHFAQNALYFGSTKEAFNDLMGSAAARAGLPIASSWNPGYANIIRSAAIAQGKGQEGEYSRWDVLSDLWVSFSAPEWTDSKLAMLLFCAVLSVNVILLVVGRRRTKSWSFAKAPVLVTVLAALVSVVFGVLWFVVMPQHARFHFHFIQRQFFVPVLVVWLALWQMANRLLNEMRNNQY